MGLQEALLPPRCRRLFLLSGSGHYVNGIAAGLSTKSNKIGYIPAKPIPLVLRNVNSFMLGARKVNPNATVQLIVTGEVKSNTGKVICSKDTCSKDTGLYDPSLETTDYLVEGIVGTV
jgi:basic membrane lipoprotein Med (substrate-binding protein (PBP1-ABC) superfamily)